jgi:hypothetical protein
VPRTPVGLAEYIRLEQFDVAELAISVNDGWQRRGIGRPSHTCFGRVPWSPGSGASR